MGSVLFVTLNHSMQLRWRSLFHDDVDYILGLVAVSAVQPVIVHSTTLTFWVVPNKDNQCNTMTAMSQSWILSPPYLIEVSPSVH